MKIPSHISVPPKEFSTNPKPADPRAGRGFGNKPTDTYRNNYDSIFRKKQPKK